MRDLHTFIQQKPINRLLAGWFNVLILSANYCSHVRAIIMQTTSKKIPRGVLIKCSPTGNDDKPQCTASNYQCGFSLPYWQIESTLKLTAKTARMCDMISYHRWSESYNKCHRYPHFLQHDAMSISAVHRRPVSVRHTRVFFSKRLKI